MFNGLKQFIFLEKAQERYLAIKNYAENTKSWQINLLTWQILSLLPTMKEKSTLAQSLRIGDMPGSDWAIFSYLLQDEQEDVVKDCILNLSNTLNHPFADKIQKLVFNNNTFLSDPEIVGAVLEYIERTGDERFNDVLNHNDIFIYSLNPLLSENINFNELILNAFLKLKIVSDQAKELCFHLLLNSKNNLNQNINLSCAIFYLFFSAKIDEISQLKEIQSKIKNSQLIKIFDLCFSVFKPLAEGKEKLFFEIALFQLEPLFLGFGLIEKENLRNLTIDFIDKYAKEFPYEVTRTILSLREKICTEVLAENDFIGIESKSSEFFKRSELIELWLSFSPYYNSNFVQSVKNPEKYHFWHQKTSLSLWFNILDFETLFQDESQYSKQWQTFFEQNLKQNIEVSIQIIYFQIYALSGRHKNRKIEKKIIENIKKCLKILPINDDFIDKIYALCISTNSSPGFIKEIYNIIPFACTSWAFIAIALTAPKIDIHTLNYAILRELQSIREALLDPNLDKDEYILEVITRFQSIIIGADKFHVEVTQATLNSLSDIANLIQSIFNSLEEIIPLKDDESHSGAMADWNGQVVMDKPILRWNAILQVCLNSHLTGDEIQAYEKILCEGLRVAPHVEKRWVVRALVHIDSDEAIKTVLYQALQHIDTDFVERTVYELFSSKRPRAQQALIRCVSKNNISDKIKLAILDRMKQYSSLEILLELKDLLQIRLPEKLERALHDSILEVSTKTEHIQETEKTENKFTSAEIDFVIKSFVQNASLLSVDSKSALRTAEMIFIQSKDWGKEAIDLSPIVNMYCKSVELIMRDIFESLTDEMMRKGELSKKLDALGYNKMIQEKMQNFEDYIGDLPLVNTIPYFSKFKLRKMLRAICLYRPGKRFTLDGPKAFALFLLVTARKSCPYSFANLFPLDYFTDLELFEFVKQVHSLQDSRNRAVHEGLTWEARDEIDNMRKQAYSIIDTCLKIGLKLNYHGK